MGATAIDVSPIHRQWAWIAASLQTAFRDERALDGPASGQLAVALRDAIEDRDLPPGSKLPPERILADHLGIGRRTVARAYETLRIHGLVERRQGSGTTVVGPGCPLPSHRVAGLGSVLRRTSAQPTLDLSGLHMPPDEELRTAVRRHTSAALEAVGLDGDRFEPEGYQPLRAAIAGRLSASGLATEEDQILITSGAQQALSLIALTFVRSGQVAVVEDPTSPGAIDAFRAAGARLLTVPVHADGADVASLAAVFARNPVGAVHLMPTYQCPTGTVMPAAGRRRIAELAAITGVPIVENLTVADLGFGTAPPPSIAAGAGDAPVLSVGSFSTVFWAGLRVGWIRGPRSIVAHLRRLKAATDLGTSTLTQALATALLEEHERMRACRRAAVSRSLRRLEELLAEHLPEWSWRTPAGGVWLWAELPRGSAIQFTELAREHGVAIAPGPLSSATSSFDDHVRLPLLRHPEVLERAIPLVGQAWRIYASTLTSP